MEEIDNDEIREAAGEFFDEAKRFIIIALTGRTGSGCSTAAKILSDSQMPKRLPDLNGVHHLGNELRKYRIIKKYADKNWSPFFWLQVRSVITSYILELSSEDLVRMLGEVSDNNEGITDFESKFIPRFKSFSEKYKKYKSNDDDPESTKEMFLEDIPKFAESFKSELHKIGMDVYTKLYQKTGDNIRASGKANDRVFKKDKFLDFPKRINKVLKNIRRTKKGDPCYIVIDAIRNPYEAFFFKERYSDFYLISINTENQNRLNHLRSSHKFSEEQIRALDRKEYPSKLTGSHKFTSQNIQKCIELSDIHINNTKRNEFGDGELAAQIAWYSSLIMHPGLVMPTSIETCMQVAYSAKISSGCISRQVGAVVTDSNYSIKSVGWNNSPKGQVPCLLRSAADLKSGSDSEAYSFYERNDPGFRSELNESYPEIVIQNADDKGLNCSFCFKDLQNKKDDEKNQVHTRSLHAEENAFLQISKYGGQKLEGGFLFTTASPCELCSKKAYQIGIKKIYYIDPYPGISSDHILNAGSYRPELNLFRGAVGMAFHKLYQPFMPYKEELSLFLPELKDKQKAEREIGKIQQKIKELQRKQGELELIARK